MSRVVLSNRRNRARRSTAFTFEFEDLVAECLGARVLSPPLPADRVSRGVARLRRDVRVARQLRSSDAPGGGAWEFVLATGQNVHDLWPGTAHADEVAGATVAVAMIEEIWPGDLPLPGHLTRWLQTFDVVLSGVEPVCAPLEAALGVPVRFMAPAVDTLAAADQARAERPVDVWAMGRRSARWHEVLQRWAAQEQRFYMHDTVTGNPSIESHEAHRDRFRMLMGHTDVFMVSEAKVDQPERTGGVGEVGFRYYEGAASGTVLVGGVPRTPHFADDFPWEDAVVEVDADGHDLVATLGRLRAEPDRVAGIRRRNVAGSLARHDAAHRVAWLRDELDLGPLPRLDERLAALARRRSLVEAGGA